MASTRSPGLEEVGGQLLAHLVVGGVVDAELDQAPAGIDPGPVEVALLRLGQGRRRGDGPRSPAARRSPRARAS